MAIDTSQGRSSDRQSGGGDDEQINLRRYLAAVARSRVMIALIVVVFTGLVVFLSLTLPKSYQATSKIALSGSDGVFSTPDAQAQQRQLATIESLLSSQEVLGEAATKIGGTDPDELRNQIESSVDSAANIIYIAVNDGDPERAALVSNAAANALLTIREEAERSQYAAAREKLLIEMERLSATGSASDRTRLDALRREVGNLSLQEELAGSELQLASTAEVPTAAHTPRPLRNSVLAFFVSLFLAVLLALLRDQLRPKVADARELSRLSNMPLLGGVPYVPGLSAVTRIRGRRAQALSAAEHEAYQALRTSFTFTLPPDRQWVILTTSAVHGEGKTTATARLGRALAHEGHKTLLIGGDLRFPTLQGYFDLPRGTGLANILELAARNGGHLNDLVLEATVHRSSNLDEALPNNLDVLTSGHSALLPAKLFSGDTLNPLFEQIRKSDYKYVLIDSAPLLGIADSQALVRLVDKVLMVARLDRLTTENVIESEELLCAWVPTPSA